MTHDITETKELIAAGATVYREIARHGGSNMLKLGFGLADDLPVIVSGLHNAHQVPAELADLTEEETRDIKAELAARFGADFDPLILDAIQASATATLAGVAAVKAWRAAMATSTEKGVQP